MTSVSHVFPMLAAPAWELGPTMLASGDVVLFGGRLPMHVKVQHLTRCPWSQVGLVLLHPAFEHPCIFESTKVSGCLDLLLGKVLRGVQLVSFWPRIAQFEGEVAVRKLQPPLSADTCQRLVDFAEEVHAAPYNDSGWIAVRALHRRNRTASPAGFFCSELVAQAYQHLGLLPRPPTGRLANNYVPADFSAVHTAPQLSLLPGWSLQDEVVLKGDPALRAVA